MIRACFVLATALGTFLFQSPTPTGPCVDIGSPKPTAAYVYHYTDSSGTVSDYTNRWPQFTPTTSQLKTTKTGTTGPMESTSVSSHKIENNMLVLSQSVASGVDGNGTFNNTTTYSPAIIGDTAVRACAGQTVTIPIVTATITTMQGKFSTKTDPGTIKVISVNESITVPAGTFETVRYTKTLTGQRLVIDEFWKSVVHGVTVKHTYVAPGSTSTEVLTAIK